MITETEHNCTVAHISFHSRCSVSSEFCTIPYVTSEWLYLQMWTKIILSHYSIKQNHVEIVGFFLMKWIKKHNKY